MGKTSVKTAWRPRFFRLDCGISAWRNSLYEDVCNSIKFGGVMISLILPKLIRSVARDDIWTFATGRPRGPHRLCYSTTQGKTAAFNCELANSRTANRGPANISLFILNFTGYGQNGAPPAWR